MKPFVLSVKAVIRDERGRCLVLRRSAASKNNAGRWDFPGGKVDAGEEFDAALVREIREETGLTVELQKVIGAAQSEMPDRIVAYLMLEGRLVRADPIALSSEHEEAAWLTPDELASPTSQLSPQFLAFAKTLRG